MLAIQSLLLAIPIVVGGVVHMLFVKGNWLAPLKVPLHAAWFGPNKTWRGFVVMPLASLPGFWLLQFWDARSVLGLGLEGAPTLSGSALGLAYVLGELPNSFIKRRLGVAPGATHPRYVLAQALADRIDSIVPVCLAYALVCGLSWHLVASTGAFGLFVHLGVSYLLVVLRIKRRM